MQVSIKGVPPVFASKGDAGADLVAEIPAPVVLHPGERKAISAGIATEFPPGHAMLVCPRSGLALNHGITVLNAPGIVDAGFRGLIKVILFNSDSFRSFTVEPGMRIAQAVFIQVVPVEFVTAEELSRSQRGGQGFGSSGL